MITDFDSKEAKELMVKYRKELADEFQVAPSTVDRWVNGVTAPLDRMQKMVVDSLNSKATRTPLQEISEIVEGMKGTLDIRFSHYSGWSATCKNKSESKSWHSHDLTQYDIEWFSSAESAIIALLENYKK